MDFLTGVQRLHRESGWSTAAPTGVALADVRNKRLFDWYADAWRDLQAERDWRWMRTVLDVTLTAGQQTYTAEGLGALRFGRWRREDMEYRPGAYVDGSVNTIWPLAFRQLDNFRQLWIYRQMGNSRPIDWTIDESEQLLIGPAPAEAYKLRIDFWKEPSELAADTDTPDLPARFQYIVMWRALMAVARQSAAPELLDRAQTEYDRLHDSLMLDQARMPHLP